MVRRVREGSREPERRRVAGRPRDDGGDQQGGGASASELIGCSAELAGDGVSYIVAEKSEIDLAAALAVLAREVGIRHIILEGGAVTNGAFLVAGLVDELDILVAPALDGGANVQGIVDWRDGLAGKVRLQFKSVNTLDHGVVELRYTV